MIRVLLSNPDGGGFARYRDVELETNLGDFVREQTSGGGRARLKIRVNRQDEPDDYVLQDDDRVSLSYTKQEGAGLSK